MKRNDRVQDLVDLFASQTELYWRWLGRFCEIDEEGVRRKVEKMKEAPLAFLRGSFYFWLPFLERANPSILQTPELLCVGDIHIENFGSWRDGEGRLVWGVNDFDDAARLPFASDIVRLAASAALGIRNHDTARVEPCVEAILDGYVDGLTRGAEPFVLEDRHPFLRDLATVKGKAAKKFWNKLQDEDEADARAIHPQALEILLATLPSGARVEAFYKRYAGTGSLGRPRYAVLAEFRGGWVAREVKAIASSSADFERMLDDPAADYRQIEQSAVRVRDPFLTIGSRWVVRRLSPESCKIELEDALKVEDWTALFHAMGCELANVHCGAASNAGVLRDALKGKACVRWKKAALDIADILADMHPHCLGRSKYP